MPPSSPDPWGAPAPSPTASVSDLLAWARRLGVDRLDAQLLLGHHLGLDRAALLARDHLVPDDPALQALVADLRRRADGVPLAYLTGRREFHGLLLQVGPAVLDPRPDTEVLVDWALECLGDGHDPAQGGGQRCEPLDVLDLGTGSGAVALALAAQRRGPGSPPTRITATDVSPEALAIAAGNGRRHGLAVRWQLGDWWSAVGEERFDLVVSNPPYIREGDPHLPALRHEPLAALVSGPEGLDALRAIVAGIPTHLKPGGWLLLEHGHDQAEAVAALLQGAGCIDVQHRRDLAGHRRCTGGRRPPGPAIGD